MRQSTRDEQRKFIKYNHLTANLLAFHNVVSMTKALHQMHQEGLTVDLEAVEAISPYRTEHINRFSDYVIINSNRMPKPLELHIEMLRPLIPE